MENIKYVWSTAEVVRETSDVITIVFDTKEQDFEYKPGQFINITLVIDGKSVSRSYSLSSSPDADEKPGITIKKIEGGLVSSYIMKHAEEITEWIVDGPHGIFYPTDDVLLSDHLILIAGGSGITPIFSIIKYILKRSPCKLTLIYSSKSWNETIFRQALDYLQKEFQEQFKILYVFTGSQEHLIKGKEFIKGRLSKLVLKKLIKKNIPSFIPYVHYFICGPAGLIDLSREAITSQDISESQIHTEYFTEQVLQDGRAMFPESAQEVLFHFFEQSNLLEVKPGETILESALQEKIPLPYSCRGGTCGVCRAKLTSGAIHMNKNFVLTEAQIKEGYILLCQSHPMDNNVTIQIGL